VRRALPLVLLIGYAAVVGYLVLASPELPLRIVHDLHRSAHRAGVPAVLAYPARIQMLLNVLMVVPLTLLAGLAWRRWTWRDWTTAGFLLSCAIELVQLFFLPDRTAQLGDVATNTIGGCVGAVLAALIRSRGRRRASPVTMATSPSEGDTTGESR
jgi:hypothetical protein